MHLRNIAADTKLTKRKIPQKHFSLANCLNLSPNTDTLEGILNKELPAGGIILNIIWHTLQYKENV